MKAVATALVLIAGAAVVLWYGNTLNSWVLGGLIGGLAALLLSIPISLTLFSYISRRHEERLRQEIEQEVGEEMSLAQVSEYPDVPAVSTRVVRGAYEREDYMLPPTRELWIGEEEDDYRQVRPARNLPATSPYQRLPVASREQTSNRMPAPQRGTYSPVTRQESNVPVMRSKDASGRRTSRRMNYPGFPGYDPGSSRSQHQTAALRAARKEAAQQYDDVEVLSTPLSRRIPSTRSQESLTAQNERPTTQRPIREVPSQPIDQYPQQPRRRRTVDSIPPQDAIQYTLPAQGESTAGQSVRHREPQTEGLVNDFTQADLMRHLPQTGQIVRNPQLQARSVNPDITTGSLQKPLVRRAPYMYEDDPLRQEMAQHLGDPIVRRSSLYDMPQDEEE
ncbi:MAG: hypothetical protein JOZ18_14765 [Chloroflexi bacterium]|nr:hypothetical protein [Chloroflexota bacterium]